MNCLLRYFKLFQKAVNFFISGLLILMMVVILVQIFTRYVIFYSLPWSEEMSRYLFVAMVLFGINIAISQDMMVRINLIDNFLSLRLKKVFDYATDLIALAVSSFFCYSTIKMVRIGRFQRSPAMHIPMSVMYGILFIGFLLAMIAIIMQIIERAGKMSEKERAV